MEYLVGTGLALIVGAFATVAGYDRDRSFYPTVLIVVASYYDLFAIIGGREGALGPEIAASMMFVALSAIGFRTSLWVVVAALAGHGLFDFVHGHVIDNPGVPAWWPMFCLSYDVSAAAYLAWRLVTRRTAAVDVRSFGARIRPQVDAELLAAKGADSNGDESASFHHLERAHVLGQNSTVEHVRVHVRMLGWGIRYRRPREIFGQVQRTIGAAIATPLRLIPHGNTGGSNVPPFRSMPVPPDLADVIAVARLTAGSMVSVIVVLATFLGAGACSTVAPPADIAPVATAAKSAPGASEPRIAYRVLGTGKPVIVMISGLGDGMATFNSVASDLAESATVIIYDRAGYGASEAVSGPKDAVAAEVELSRLLSQAGVDGPFVLVGHSLGGLFAEYFAAKHPNRILALVLEESRPAPYADACEAAGLPMCTPTPAMVVSALAGVRAEVDGMAATVAQVKAVGSVSGKPVLILSRPMAPGATPTDDLWAKAQKDLAARYPGSQHIVASGGTHNIHLTQRAWFVGSLHKFLKESLP
jgi:pimeloyl-ACP methyl ester carboxylesterase